MADISLCLFTSWYYRFHSNKRDERLRTSSLLPSVLAKFANAKKLIANANANANAFIKKNANTNCDLFSVNAANTGYHSNNTTTNQKIVRQVTDKMLIFFLKKVDFCFFKLKISILRCFLMIFFQICENDLNKRFKGIFLAKISIFKQLCQNKQKYAISNCIIRRRNAWIAKETMTCGIYYHPIKYAIS